MGVSLKDLGQHRLKGMERLEHLYQSLVADLPRDFPPMPTALIEPPLKLWLLGEFRAEFNHNPIQAIDSPRLQSFFAYLILHHKIPISKQQLAGLFWPETDENQARTNLRRLMFRLRRAWSGFNQYLTSTGNTLQWKPEQPFWCDVYQFHQHAQEAKRGFVKAERYELLKKAAALFKGELFPGCYEDWIIPERDECQRLFLSVMDELIRIAEGRGDYISGINFAEQLLGNDPLYEPAYMALMRMHLQNGNPGGSSRSIPALPLRFPGGIECRTRHGYPGALSKSPSSQFCIQPP
jgi:DNA-binding SARP family transcriptional activator